MICQSHFDEAAPLPNRDLLPDTTGGPVTRTKLDPVQYAAPFCSCFNPNPQDVAEKPQDKIEKREKEGGREREREG